MKRIFLAAILGGLLLAPPVSGDQEVSVIRVGLFGMLELHASVYLCTVAKREPFAVQTDQMSESGKVELTVNKVLFGTKRENITLPYRFWTSMTGEAWAGPMTWPQFQDGNKLLCMVVPHGHDGMTPEIPAINEVASKVLVVTGENDAQVQEMMAICALYETRNTPEFIPGLEKAIADPRQELRSFGMQALLEAGGITPDQVMNVVQSRVPHYTGEAEDAEGIAFIGIFQSVIMDEVRPNKDIPWLLRCVAAFAQSESKKVRQFAIDCLAYDISNSSWRKLRLQDGLNAAEQNALRKTLAKSQSDFHDGETLGDIRTIRRWLDR